MPRSCSRTPTSLLAENDRAATRPARSDQSREPVFHMPARQVLPAWQMLELEANLYYAVLAGLCDVERVLRLGAGEAVRDDGRNIDLA